MMLDMYEKEENKRTKMCNVKDCNKSASQNNHTVGFTTIFLQYLIVWKPFPCACI